MKVIRVVSELDFGGVEQVLATSVPAIAQIKDIDVSIIVLGRGGRVAQELIQQGIKVNVLNLNPRIPNMGLILKLKQIFLESNPEVVHSQGAEANFHGILAASWAGIKRIVGEEIGIPNHHSYWKYIFRWVYSKAHVIIAISLAVKTRIVGLKEVESGKIKVIYNPVMPITNNFCTSRNESMEIRKIQFDYQCQRNIADKPFVFISTCRLVPIKNLDRVISAFLELSIDYASRSLELWIVGDGPLKENLVRKLKNNGLMNSVKLWGYQNDIFYFLKHADVFVLLSLSEGSSVSLAEAMVAGLPSVVTSSGGASELLGESRSGILVDPLDLSEIKKAMSFILNMTELERIEMGKRAQNEIKKFHIDKYLKSIISIYLS
ncbi:Glycosyltransferase involved in cell wall bisynthesis [Cyclobacterium lianum]|uniref:Glycosyltransferase involved in cell wall bisynthesis n=1 Tax=Cyclobacterium lianum TaxID=388280 RepID=A0A1M7QL94_9BACT|nr:glycosyltransferase [Cyclobacterium lianum]SHN31756.1 Glycosyltransferase involved in cell wall bisynthesis [Cyclobacterium lianum]